MFWNLTTDFRRFEYSHWLNNNWRLNFKSFTDVIYFSCVGQFFKDLIFLMKCMSDFIDCMRLWLYEFSILKGFFFKEETYIICRFFEVFIEIMFSIFSIKNSDFLRCNLKVFYESINLFDSLRTLISRNKAGNHCISIFSIEI